VKEPRHDAPAKTGWEPYLDPDEKVLWQGGPDASVVLNAGSISALLFGLAFAGFALIWMIMAAMDGEFFWMFGLIHFSAGVGIAGGSLLWPAWRRRHSWYTLTDRRAFIATDMPVVGRKLKSYPIASDTVLEFENNTPASLFFHREYRRTKNGTREVRVGFERIQDGKRVYDLMRGIQRQAVAP